MRIHFIAIGGSVMHNLAIALHKKGYTVTGSDDEIFEPSSGRLARFGLLPATNGWNPELITQELDGVILGMHARADNPELHKALELGVQVYSFPEFLYRQTENKLRIVIGGSHGKTTITSMIMHVLRKNGIAFDYMVGAQLEGFDTMVGLQDESKIAVFEGDEYLASPIDRRSKFHLYHPHVALLSGIAWDHINVFPEFDNYVEQFRIFAGMVQPGGKLFYCKKDPLLQEIAGQHTHIQTFGYEAHPALIEDTVTYLKWGNREIRLKVFGEHNLENIAAAKAVCSVLDISDEQFYRSIQSYSGASRRLEILAENDHTAVYRDFAHAPSKLKATVKAVKQQFPHRKLVACMELHTFSSLNRDFLPYYNGCIDDADIAYIYYSPQTLKQKKLASITEKMVTAAFGNPDLSVITDTETLFNQLKKLDWNNSNLLLMSSGNFGGFDLNTFAGELTGKPVKFQRGEWIRNPQANL
jgi:UDP-N-acetylmuramate: L-alanyl-gamma-D-glutamyl-meso-diaminopimelate ligase